MDKPKQRDEKKVIGASYVYDFYTMVNFLNDAYSQYLNVILEIHNKYGDQQESLKKMAEYEKEIYLKATQNLRYYCNRSYIMFKSIFKGLSMSNKDIDKTIDTEIEDCYKNIKVDFAIKSEDVEKYAIALNSFIVTDIIKKLLEENIDIIESLYSKNAAE